MKKETGIFDNPKNIKIMMTLFYIVLITLVAADFFVDHHPYFGWDGVAGFFAAFGFAACVLVINIAKLLRFFLMRPENHYDE